MSARRELTVLSSVAEEICSFRKGVTSFGVLDLLGKFPDEGLKKLMHVEENYMKKKQKLSINGTASYAS